MLCKKCGAQINDDAKFCDNCGMQTNTEQAKIKEEVLKKRQQNPPPYKKNAIIIAIILWVAFPGAGCLLSEGELLFVGIMCGVAGAFTALAWIASTYSYNKYMNSTDSHDINRK